MLPAVLGGFKQSAQQQSNGLEGLLGVIGGLGGGDLFAKVVGPEQTPIETGNSLLGGIFGSREGSIAVAQNAASTSGLDASLLKKMLPIVAMLVAGALARNAGASTNGGASGGLGGLLGGLLRGSRPQQHSAGGLGSLGAMLDIDGDGNPLNDILGMAGKFAGR